MTITIWLQSTNTCPQINTTDITILHIINTTAHDNAQYLRQHQNIAGNGLKGIISQFQSVQHKSEKTIK